MASLAAIRGPPHLPVVGALPFFLKHGGASGLVGVHRKLYEYGNIVAFSIFDRELVTIFDPAEYMKVHRAAGRTPTGGTGDLWMFHRYFSLPRVRERWGLMPMAFSDGEDWRRPRHALQHGLFGHEDASSYQPAINEVVDDAAAELPSWTASGPDLQAFTCRVTFELITKVMLGTRVNVLSRSGAHPRDERFVEETLTAQSSGSKLLYSPLGQAAVSLRSPEWRRFEGAMDFVLERSHEHVQSLVDTPGWADAEIVPGSPYLRRVLAIDELSREEVVLNVAGLLQGGVDTTANTISWLLVHLASNPEEQDLLAQELSSVLGTGPFDMAALASMPRLKAVIRESHRLTPTVSGTVRWLDKPIELVDSRRDGASVVVPPNTRLVFSSVGLSMDPALVEAPSEFRPERWMAPKSERKGSTLEVLDHNLVSQPFSFGPRMCLGARLAYVELYAVLARFVRDFRFELEPAGQRWSVRNDFLTKPDPFPKLRVEKRGGL